MTRLHVSETFHWPVGQARLLAKLRMCLGVRALVQALMGMCVFVFHLWYSWAATCRDTKDNTYLCSTHYRQSEWVLFIFLSLCGLYVLSPFDTCSMSVHGCCTTPVLAPHLSPCSPHRHARRSGSLRLCLSTPGTPVWGGWSSPLGPALLHTPPTTDWRLGSRCLRHTAKQWDIHFLEKM